MSLAIRNLIQEKARFALSVAGVALAVMLILVLNGFLDGMYRQFAAYLYNTPGSVMVSQEGVNNFLGATSLLPQGTTDAAREVEGASKVVPVFSRFVILDLHSKKQPAYMVGYDPLLGGGPWELAQGRAPRTDDEVVLDRVLAQRHNMTIGDRFNVMGREFTVVGLSEGTTSWMTSFFFVRKSAAESLLRAPGAASFLLVTPSEGVSASKLSNRLDDLPGAEASLKPKVISNDSKLFSRVFSAPLRLMATIAFFVGTLVVGLVVYTATVERPREYGVLKAIGLRNRLLYGAVLTQALVSSVVGSVCGVVLALGAARLIMYLRPQFLVTIEPRTVLWALLAGLAMALLAALVPARSVARLAPADVFRR